MLGLELLEQGPLDMKRLPDQYRRAAETTKSGSARLVLHKWRTLSQTEADTSGDELAALSPADFAGVE